MVSLFLLLILKPSMQVDGGWCQLGQCMRMTKDLPKCITKSSEGRDLGQHSTDHCLSQGGGGWSSDTCARCSATQWVTAQGPLWKHTLFWFLHRCASLWIVSLQSHREGWREQTSLCVCLTADGAKTNIAIAFIIWPHSWTHHWVKDTLFLLFYWYKNLTSFCRKVNPFWLAESLVLRGFLPKTDQNHSQSFGLLKPREDA